jgi:hypothetical protein
MSKRRMLLVVVAAYLMGSALSAAQAAPTQGGLDTAPGQNTLSIAVNGTAGIDLFVPPGSAAGTIPSVSIPGYISIVPTAAVGTSCTFVPNGTLAQDGAGNILSCVSGVWNRYVAVPNCTEAGQVIVWDGSSYNCKMAAIAMSSIGGNYGYYSGSPCDCGPGYESFTVNLQCPADQYLISAPSVNCVGYWQTYNGAWSGGYTQHAANYGTGCVQNSDGSGCSFTCSDAGIGMAGNTHVYMGASAVTASCGGIVWK